VDGFIRSLPEQEFILWTIVDLENRLGNYNYELPSNVSAIHEICLETVLKMRVGRIRNPFLPPGEKQVLRQLIRCQDPDWRTLLEIFNEKPADQPIQYCSSEDFLELIKEFSAERYPYAGFADLYWTVRSMFLPLFFLLRPAMPEADLYHGLSTGYAGVLGGLASLKYNAPFVLSEHGIHLREREEEILRSDWAIPEFKELWVSMFFMYSQFAYGAAHRVTSLYGQSSAMQQELGCPAEKAGVISNGIHVDEFAAIQPKKTDDWVDIGAIVRFAPIKDIKTMISTFSRLKQEIEKARLHILGATDDEQYYQECLDLIDYLGVKDITITGLVDVPSYLENIDFTIMTSISEGQPFAILESLAASRPVVATDVGACRELIEGNGLDGFGSAGMVIPPMHQSELLGALVEMCKNPDLRTEMGEAGQRRIRALYEHDDMVEKYQRTYQEAISAWQE
jgi:glycosyltransferase involved in cell wall biosynthesis